MSEDKSSPIIICEFGLDDGYIIKNFFAFNALKNRPVITIHSDKISADNCTVDGTIHGASYLHGDEIGLTWCPYIPYEKRKLSIVYNSADNPTAFNRIKKKDKAQVVIAQNSKGGVLNFDGPGSSSEFIIYVSCGGGGYSREGVQSIAASREHNQDLALIKQPNPQNSSLLVIPIKTFKQMIESFSKCKKISIKISFFSGGQEIVDGIKYDNSPGIIFTTDMTGDNPSGAILEKYGDVPDTDTGAPISGPDPNLLNFNNRSVVNFNNSRVKLDLEHKPLEPNEFLFDADKIFNFNRLASMHNEGNVRIYYQEGCHLRISHRFGGFGECELNLHNSYVGM